MITLKQLHYALAVEQTLHFKNAAEACFVSPSTLSNALTKLEQQIGVQIFERDNKKVIVTALGKAVLEKAQAIKIQADDIQKLGENQDGKLSGPLKLGVIPTIGPYLLPMVLPAINRDYPLLQLDIVEDHSDVLVNEVHRGDLDLAILALPFPLNGLLSFGFWEEDFFWLNHIDNTMAQHNEISACDVEPASMMLLEDGHCLKDHALLACQLSAGGHHSIRASSLNTLVQLVAGEMGTTLVPQMAVEQLLKANPLLKKAHLNEPGPHREIALIMRPGYTGIKNVEQLKVLFEQQLNQHFST
jgi:LysR family transcriptional regulator, hydrogen peroxide-inducible genes activator